MFLLKFRLAAKRNLLLGISWYNVVHWNINGWYIYTDKRNGTLNWFFASFIGFSRSTWIQNWNSAHGSTQQIHNNRIPHTHRQRIPTCVCFVFRGVVAIKSDKWFTFCAITESECRRQNHPVAYRLLSYGRGFKNN